MKDEIVDIYDENGLFLNIKMNKKEAKEKNLFHKAVHIWILVGDKILIQQRSSLKKIFPNLWDISVAGHVKSGDNSLNTAVREITEELGIMCDKKDLEYLYCLRRTGKEKGNIFFDTYLLKLDDSFDIKTIILEKEEVRDVKLVDRSYLEEVVKGQDLTFAPRQNECLMFLNALDSRKSTD